MSCQFVVIFSISFTSKTNHYIRITPNLSLFESLRQMLTDMPPHFSMWRCSPTWAMECYFMRFLDHTQRRITFGRLIWTTDQLVAVNCTWQHKTLTRERH
jgi:hypothetical protein